MKVNCHNSGTSDDINMKFGQVTKLDKRKRKHQKIWQRRHINKDSRTIAVKVMFSLTVTFYITKTEKGTKKISDKQL